MCININNIVNYGDMMAIPFFALATYYFCNKENRTPLEDVLLLFCIVGFICDLFFTVIFFNKRLSCVGTFEV